jgi:hypothetical protein
VTDKAVWSKVVVNLRQAERRQSDRRPEPETVSAGRFVVLLLTVVMVAAAAFAAALTVYSYAGMYR